MAALAIGPMEVIFSFDTTGSMSQVLDEVKGRVSDIVQRLQADIPGFRVGIIAHGDYCDREHFYVIRTLDLTDSVADVVTFVHETGGTGGGDEPECYELALKQAGGASWSPFSNRILVLIGDSFPHEVDYPLNTDRIDWRHELDNLKKNNVKIYGVQVQNGDKSTDFFQTLTQHTGGQHLRLDNMQRICEAIMGVCYREKGAEFLENFEAEVRQKEPEKTGADLDDLFGTLRREESRRSDATALLDDDDDIDDDDVDNDGDIKMKKKRSSPYNRSIGMEQTKSITSVAPSRKRKASTVIPDVTQPQNVKRPKKLPSVKKDFGRSDFRSRRELIAPSLFNHLSWSSWKLAVSPRGHKTEVSRAQWKTLPRCGNDQILWRKDLLQDCTVKSSRSDKSAMFFELSVTSPTSKRRKVVSYRSIPNAARLHNPSGIFGLPWYRGLFRSMRPQLNKAAMANCRVYVRWVEVNFEDRHLIQELRKTYNYAWNKKRCLNATLGF